MIDYIHLTVILPLAGFLINGLFGSKIKNEKVIGLIGSSTVGAAFVIALLSLFELIALPAEDRTHVVELFTWLSVGGIEVSFAYLVDQLSIVMALIVTGVGFLIHIYSIGYMHGDPGFWKFFAYLNLFIFAMMNLILGDNFLVLFLGWEGVGLCSYLLIGFWYDKKFEKGTVSQAAKKAFVVNRIGDFGFLLGMFLIFSTFGSLNFLEVFPQVGGEGIDQSVYMFIALFMFIGATGKSAQIPLYVWLPDAMAGPTPVSALIHAATMVTAGVYMVARASVIFAAAPDIMMVVAVIGALTAFFAATIGLVQNDIKKVLAYSTVSQLGYMFLACGVGAFGAGIFHVMTHAFFKALLFLGAGSVIHAMHENQNIQDYGGLKKYMPVTYITFLFAALAIAGFPGLSGFFSKDEILWYSYANGNIIFWVIGAVTAVMTAFYMFRLVSLTFFGKERFSHDKYHPHESPSTMTIPLIILGILSVVVGFIGVPEIFSGEHGNIFHNWLHPVFEPAEKLMAAHAHHSHSEELLLMGISVFFAVAGIIAAIIIFTKRREIAEKVSASLSGVYNTLMNKYYVDEFYFAAVVNPIKNVSEKFLSAVVDIKLIDGIINGSANLVDRISTGIRKLQTGVAQFYAIIMMTGIALALLWVILSL